LVCFKALVYDAALQYYQYTLCRHAALTYGNHVFADWLLRMYDLLVGSMHNDNLSSLMNGPIRKKLGIIPSHVTWGGIVYTELFTWCFFSNYLL